MDTPSTNNALESFNLVIKNEETVREKLPLARFLEKALHCVEKWTSEFQDKRRTFYLEKPIALPLWTEGNQWAKRNKKVTSECTGDFERFFCPAGDQSSLSSSEIADVINMRYNTFKQYKKQAFKIWVVDMSKKAENWSQGKCTCPVFFKKYMCKHVIGLALRQKK